MKKERRKTIATLFDLSCWKGSSGANHVNAQVATGEVVNYNIKATLSTAAAIMLTMAFLPMTASMAGRLVDDKKARVKEHLRVMGVTPLAYLIATILVAMIRVGFVSVALLILIGSFQVVPFHSLMGIWVSIVAYGFSLAGFAQIMPAFFSRPGTSNAVCSLFIAVFGFGSVFASPIAAVVPVLSVLFSPSAFVYSAALLLNNNPNLQMSMTPASAIGCLIFQVFAYSAVSQYL